MEAKQAGKSVKSKSISFSIDKDQYEKFRRLQNEAKELGIELTLKKIIFGKIKEK